MQLKKYTDYALRVLIFCGTKPHEELSSIKEISEVFQISQHHLGKIVLELNKLGLLETIRGRKGGIRLACKPEAINVGELVRILENDALLECFNSGTKHCVLSPACKLKHVLGEALQAFYRVLDNYTIHDFIVNDKQLRELMGI